MRRRGLTTLLLFVAIAVGLFATTLAVGNSPLLGLDLQGGASVVLQSTREVEGEQLDVARDIIRNRVDALGVAEPEISRQGDSILIQLPGVDNQDEILEIVGQTAELRFRPVLGTLPPVGDEPTTTTTTAPAGGATTTAPPTTAAPPTVPPGTDEQGLPAGGLAPGENAGMLPQTATTSPPQTLPPDFSIPPDASLPPGVSIPADLGTAVPPEALEGEGPVCIPSPSAEPLPETLDEDGLSPPDADQADAAVVLPQLEEGEIVCRYHLGPTAATGSTLDTADAVVQQDGTWVVNPTFKGGADGIDLFNQVATTCFNREPTCPSGQLAIVLDRDVVSAPAIQQASFERDQIQITGDFSEDEAKDLALVLRFGALPVELEPQQVQTVSATLGRDALKAGVIAGIVGLLAVALFLVAYYRLLGLLAILSLSLSGCLLWSLISYLGESRGLALTLAGVTGIIVSIGVSVDSNVVYFENIKEDIRSGRTLRSAVRRSFSSTFSTILKADGGALIGALLLWWLTVGPVRGFALFLALSTLLDLIASYFFMRNAVHLVVQSGSLADRPGLFGIPKAAEDDEGTLEGATT